jgi:hypothetical protein
MCDCIDEVNCIYTKNSIVFGVSEWSVIELTCLWASFVLWEECFLKRSAHERQFIYPGLRIM